MKTLNGLMVAATLALVALGGWFSDVLAQTVPVVVPAVADSGTIINAGLAGIGGHIVGILTVVIGVAIVLGLIALFRRSSFRAARG